MNLKLGDLQLQIMKVLWRLGSATVADVHAELSDRQLAYTTVATMLRKMEDRRLVTHREDRTEGRPRFIYSPAVSEGDVTQSMTNDLVEQLFEGNLASAVSHLLQARDVSRAELNELERLIRRHKERG